ncbi:hypothetical protein [Fangia hongkongensis]|uniref:hypothetical protein n=1 Tax=Fangia hongkongensis TaxID=270495 RepID=UPI00036DB8FA|nr:hypothetical protein [Fangia hongkongensis]MBK2124618.1 hypothetical protein [Fangia hongkongensis]
MISNRGIKTGLSVAVFAIAITGAYAASTNGYSQNDFKEWAKHLIGFISQIEYFVQVVATLSGMWFVYSGLQLFRKHHTTQGAQGEHLKNGSGHLLIGVLLMCLVPGIQMIQGSIMSGAGEKNAQTMFTVNENALNQ